MPWPPSGDSEHTEDTADTAITPTVSQPSTTVRGYPLPSDIETLNFVVGALLELQATNSVNTHLTACLDRLRAEQAASTPVSTSTSTTNAASSTAVSTTPLTCQDPNHTLSTIAPIPCQHPNHILTTVSGRGAGSPEAFQKIIKTNWHGRLGRAHMVDVDALSTAALTELDCFLWRKLHAIFPRGRKFSGPDADTIFMSLAALGLRLEDRGAYADVPNTPDDALHDAAMTTRGADLVAWYYAHGKYEDYWRGFAVETLVELAKYRGLFNDEGFLRVP